LAGLAVTAEPIVRIVLTDKWLPCVPFLQIFCASYALWPIHTANLQAINALGRSDIFLKLEIIKKILGLSILGIAVFHGVYAMAFGTLIGGIIATFINAYPNLRLLNYSYKEQMKDIMPSLLLSLVMAAIVYNLRWLNMTDVALLTIQVCTGAIVYIGLARMMKLESYTYLVTTIKEILKKRQAV